MTYTPAPIVRIFDTTLRDGEQSPGYSMTMKGKLRMARALSALKVDVIEAGFAAASPGDAEAVRAVAEEADGPIVCSLARVTERDIDAAAKALDTAKRKRAHVFIGTSPLHREHKLKMRKGEILDAIDHGVRYARKVFGDVEFSAEDAMRTEKTFLAECLKTANEAGATTLNVPDTVGYFTPEETHRLFSYLIEAVEPDDDTVFSAHCHDDLGMAVANSLAAVRAGVRQIECTISGIGERAGNCAMEEAVMAIKTRRDSYGVDTLVDTTQFYDAARTLEDITGEKVARNKAITGRNAFAHEAGIHQHGMLANRETYEIMKPEDVGAPHSSLVLGKHSGKHALFARLEQLGHEVSPERRDSVFAAFKILADEKHEVSDEELRSLVSGASNRVVPAL
ncbi:2-isopropylmalate synthase [Parvularcula dongshanensis]|uniref:2-isopropylmalate synthase n=1 Tax=Parvularcula dongshanensis TaxID=1173995 RepID=A0A840I3Y6_9PROT|nr:2-isopropylmalate synthase [Parvularcula dongshanensis]MBB4658878.1 2-isopropylmalate synthase [Parvularcula dongshanensis]